MPEEKHLRLAKVHTKHIQAHSGRVLQESEFSPARGSHAFPFCLAVCAPSLTGLGRDRKFPPTLRRTFLTQPCAFSWNNCVSAKHARSVKLTENVACTMRQKNTTIPGNIRKDCNGSNAPIEPPLEGGAGSGVPVARKVNTNPSWRGFQCFNAGRGARGGGEDCRVGIGRGERPRNARGCWHQASP